MNLIQMTMIMGMVLTYTSGTQETVSVTSHQESAVKNQDRDRAQSTSKKISSLLAYPHVIVKASFVEFYNTTLP